MDGTSILLKTLHNYFDSRLPVEIERSILAFVVFLAIFAIFFAAFRFLLHNFRKQRPNSLFLSLKNPLTVLIFIFSLGIGLQTLPQAFRQQPLVHEGWKVLLILTAFWLIDSLLGTLMDRSKLKSLEESGTRSLIAKVTHFVTLIIAALILLDTLGVSITPVLASLGVGSVAVALALQDTLSNFFSGIYLLIDRPVRIGDYIRLSDGFEGYVSHIGWRSTHIRHVQNYTVVIPNSKLSSTTVINFDMPESELSVPVELGIAFGSNLDLVESVTREVAQRVLTTNPGAISTFEAKVRFDLFKDTGIGLRVILRVSSISQSPSVKHDFIKALAKRYSEEKISFANPPAPVPPSLF